MTTLTLDAAPAAAAPAASWAVRLRGALAGTIVREAVAEALATALPAPLRSTPANVGAVLDLTERVIEAVGRVMDEQVLQREFGHRNKARPAPQDKADPQAQELADAEAAARYLLFTNFFRALEGQEDPSARFVLALERSEEAEIANPGALLVAYRWGLLDADRRARAEFGAWFVRRQ